MDNYFDFFGFPERFDIDLMELKKRFFNNSKRFHPDFHTLSDPEKQMEALQQSAQNNKAYKVLMDTTTRDQHLLEVKGLWDADGKQDLPQEFFMEMMTINETLMELELDPNSLQLEAASRDVEDYEEGLDQSLSSLKESYDQTLDASILVDIKALLLKKRYLLRIREKIDKFALR